jgi:hypothetical protein
MPDARCRADADADGADADDVDADGADAGADTDAAATVSGATDADADANANANAKTDPPTLHRAPTPSSATPMPATSMQRRQLDAGSRGAAGLPIPARRQPADAH